MDKLNCRSDSFSLVLNDSGADVFKSSKYIVDKIRNSDLIDVIYIACIKHDRDKDDFDNVKTVHYHLVIHINAVCRIRTILNLFVEIFHCNENQVSIEKCSSLVMQTRYLIHLDDIDKESYDIWDIVTNDMEYVVKSINYIKSISDIDRLIVLVRQHKNLLELMSVIGYENYKKYRIVIADIRRELKYQL